jgi:plastocyanin
MRNIFVSVALVALAGAQARAQSVGTIEGTLGPSAPKHAAVWLEGVSAASWSAPKETITISQRGARFNPDFVVLPVGQTVVMPNDDRLIHNVFSVSPAKKFDLGHYPQGESRSVVFDKPGVIDLFCNIHENMHGTVVVAPSTFFAVADATGHFAIARVPAGSYKLNVYSPDGGGAQAQVKVTAGGSTTINLTLEKK